MSKDYAIPTIEGNYHKDIKKTETGESFYEEVKTNVEYGVQAGVAGTPDSYVDIIASGEIDLSTLSPLVIYRIIYDEGEPEYRCLNSILNETVFLGN